MGIFFPCFNPTYVIIYSSKMISTLLKLFFLFYLIAFPAPSFTDLRIIDADTIVLDGEKVRLFGIDAPEISQLCLNENDESYFCGKKAIQKLIELIESSKSQSVDCDYKDSDMYGRFIGYCWVDRILINAWLVSHGWAMAYHQYSNEFVEEEIEAKKKKLGIWSGTFVEPWKWRKGTRLISRDLLNPEACIIKGNISSSGEKIYHVPDGQYYSRTKINESKGEKWFCSEKEALSFGWRKAKR